MGYSEALRLQAQLVHWWNTPQGKDYAEMYTAERDFAEVPLNEVEQSRLRYADPFWVSKDITKLIDVASTTMPYQSALPFDLPTQTGFVVFADNIIRRDADEKPVALRAFTWSPCNIKHTGPGLLITIYTEWVGLQDRLRREGKIIGRLPGSPDLALVHYYVWPYGQTLAQLRNEIALGKRMHNADPSFSVEKKLELHLEERRFVQAFWAFVQQPLMTSVTPTAPTRRVRKAVQRSGITQRAPEVNVVTLRKKHTFDDGTSEEGSAVEWTHRWMVSGHWHRYHTKLGIRLNYLLPYVKGPDDKPLIVKDRVFKVTR